MAFKLVTQMLWTLSNTKRSLTKRELANLENNNYITVTLHYKYFSKH